MKGSQCTPTSISIRDRDESFNSKLICITKANYASAHKYYSEIQNYYLDLAVDDSHHLQ